MKTSFSPDNDGDEKKLSAQGNYMTTGCAERLKAEIKDLLYVQRPDMVKTVAWAASNGDRSENADYIYGKKRLREIDRRIRHLTKRMDAAIIIDPVGQASVAKGRVLFGSTVTVENEDGEEKVLSIVGVDEIDSARGRISWVSPIGRALLGSSEGDAVTVKTPAGDKEYEVVEVAYIALD
ncbi:transcription elongation factor GreB [uncultured Desulfuromonas sp.]|uniref:transcription elongation factor GreB n=1 Tax=uncultured Desulfuromonas sp. TaxID=181013 RepID=UPI002AAC3650|nr:transcription elongation factor GreB [uncultured Desulfuromonas sp.]